MFFLGHMSWAYIWATVAAKGRGGRLFIPAVLMLGVLPDVDLFLGDYGVNHHTFFHSILFWIVLFIPALVAFRWLAIPYLAAVLQHFIFGDFLVGEVMLFWPFDLSFFGVNNTMFSVVDVILESIGFFLAAGLMYYNGDLRRLLSISWKNVVMFIPLLALVSSMLFFAVDWPIIPLIAYVWRSPILTVIVVEHLVLIGFYVVSTIQGLRKL